MTPHKARQRRILPISLLLIFGFAVIAAQVASLSAYGACRKSAMHVKAFAVWQYIDTIEDRESTPFHYTTMVFSDGHNRLACPAIGIGPIWFVVTVSTTLLPCPSCVEGYFGVSP